jgi:hypothetical protein
VKGRRNSKEQKQNEKFGNFFHSDTFKHNSSAALEDRRCRSWMICAKIVDTLFEIMREIIKQ